MAVSPHPESPGPLQTDARPTTTASAVSDDLLRELIAVGQVDLLVGLPTFNNADTVPDIVRNVHVAIARHFPRDRVVIVNSDGGSTDGTPELVREASLGEDAPYVASRVLRTVHRISAPHAGVPGKPNALRTLFAAAELLGARVVIVLDPDVVSPSPDWVERLARPILAGADLVAPIYQRHPLDGPLITQLVRPLVRTAYGVALCEPVGGDFGCSGSLAGRYLSIGGWEGLFDRFGITLFLTTTAVATGARVEQAPLGPRTLAPARAAPSLNEVFHDVSAALFGCLEAHATWWISRPTAAAPPPESPAPGPLGPAPIDSGPMAQAFVSGVRDLGPVLEAILEPATLAAVRAVADASPLSYPDELWVRTVCELAGAYHRSVMHRMHLLQALAPLYQGRAASFLCEHAGSTAGAAASLERLAGVFEENKPYLVQRWQGTTAR